MNDKNGLICIDWDGTLLRSDNIITKCIIKTLETMNLPIPSQKVLQRLSGESEERILQICLQNHTQHIADFWPTFRSIYAENTLELTQGALEFLKRHQDFSIAVVSNKNDTTIIAEIEHFGLSELVDCVYAANLYVPKPDPLMINLAMKDMQCSQKNTWMIGDSIADFQAAKNAKVTYIPVHAGHWCDDYHRLDDITLKL